MFNYAIHICYDEFAKAKKWDLCSIIHHCHGLLGLLLGLNELKRDANRSMSKTRLIVRLFQLINRPLLFTAVQKYFKPAATWVTIQKCKHFPTKNLLRNKWTNITVAPDMNCICNITRVKWIMFTFFWDEFGLCSSVLDDLRLSHGRPLGESQPVFVLRH